MGRGPRSSSASQLSASNLLYGPRRGVEKDRDQRLRMLYPDTIEDTNYGDSFFARRQQVSGGQGQFIFTTALNPEDVDDADLAEFYLRRDFTPDHIVKAEQCVDRAVEIMGPQYRQVFAERCLSDLDGQDGIASDLVPGQSYEQVIDNLGQYRARKHVEIPGLDFSDNPVLTDEEKDQLNQAKEAFCYPADAQITRQQWLEEARRMLFTDQILLNDFRSPDNIILSPSGPVSIFDGLAFSPSEPGQLAPLIAHVTSPDAEEERTKERYEAIYERDVFEQTGGFALRDEERQALMNLQQSDLADQIEEQFGVEVADRFRARVDETLASGQIGNQTIDLIALAERQRSSTGASPEATGPSTGASVTGFIPTIS